MWSLQNVLNIYFNQLYQIPTTILFSFSSFQLIPQSQRFFDDFHYDDQTRVNCNKENYRLITQIIELYERRLVFYNSLIKDSDNFIQLLPAT